MGRLFFMTLLFLNSLGTGEVILILMVVLMLFGAKSIPGLARNLGRGMREIRNASNEIKRDIQDSAIEMKRDMNLNSTLEELNDIDLDLDSKKSSSDKKNKLDNNQKGESA